MHQSYSQARWWIGPAAAAWACSWVLGAAARPVAAAGTTTPVTPAAQAPVPTAGLGLSN